MQLDPDFREFVESFNAHEVRYLVVGGYALAAHGCPLRPPGFDRAARLSAVSDRLMVVSRSQRVDALDRW